MLFGYSFKAGYETVDGTSNIIAKDIITLSSSSNVQIPGRWAFQVIDPASCEYSVINSFCLMCWFSKKKKNLSSITCCLMLIIFSFNTLNNIISMNFLLHSGLLAIIQIPDLYQCIQLRILQALEGIPSVCTL